MTYPFPAGNVIWAAQDLIALLCTRMSPDDWRPITGAAVLIAESGGNPLAVGRPIWYPGSAGHLSIDLGLFQLNSYWWTPHPTTAQSFDPQTAYEFAWPTLNKRTGWSYNWKPWTAFRTLTYQQHLTTALHGMQTYREMMGLDRGPF